MKTITGMTTKQTISFLKSYRLTPANDLGGNSYFICNYLLYSFLVGRSRIMTRGEARELKVNIWHFIAHWYDKLGYKVPLNTHLCGPLFEYCDNEIFYFKVQERKEFVKQVLVELEDVIIKEENQLHLTK